MMAMQSVNYQYLWMAHWMGKSCSSVLRIYNEDAAGAAVGQASVMSMNMGCESNSRSEWYLFPLSSYNQNIDSLPTIREEYVTNSHTSRDTSSHGTVTLGTNTTDFPSSMCELASKTLEFSSEDDVSLLESIKDGPVQRQKSVGSTERESLPSSKPCLHILPGTTSSVVPYKHRAHGTPAVSFMFQIDDLSASKLNSLCCVDDQRREVNSSSGAGFSPSCNNPERATGLEEDVNPGSYLLQKMPVCSVHDEETLKICSIRNFAENVPEFPQRISQMTHHLCVTNRFGVSFSKGDQIIRESKLSTEGNATKALYELFSLSSPGRGKQGPKLQYIGHTSSIEGKKDTVDCVTRNSSHGIASFPPVKDLYVHKDSITACATFGSSREVGSRKTETVIPNICEDTPDIMTARGLTGKRSTSRTDSLEVENHSSHVQSPMGEELCVPEAQPNHRLVKRLKLNTCDSVAQGTRTFRTEPASSGRKVDNFFTKIMRYNITSKDLVKDQKESSRSLVLFKNLDFSSMDSVKEHEELTLSHPWIQRWRHSQPETPPMKPAARVVCEPQVPKSKLKKQLPSFEAMALMGKASNRFQPCEFRKRGSVTVWNTGF